MVAVSNDQGLLTDKSWARTLPLMSSSQTPFNSRTPPSHNERRYAIAAEAEPPATTSATTPAAKNAVRRCLAGADSRTESSSSMELKRSLGSIDRPFITARLSQLGTRGSGGGALNIE